jgi:NAD+ kinase
MIGVVGPGTASGETPDAAGAVAGAIVDAIDEAGETPRSGPAADVLAADPEAVVAVGETGVIEVVRADDGDPPPVLAVGPGDGPPGVPDDAAGSAVAALASGAFGTVEHPLLAVEAGGKRAGRVAFDAMVVTSDPGGISEYRIDAGSNLGTVRADGVVVATPAGSHGYARAAGGPHIASGAPVAAVVPVAPFTMTPEQWVVDLDPPVGITSERDVEVSLVLDDDRRETDPEATVSIALGGTLSFVVPGGPDGR